MRLLLLVLAIAFGADALLFSGQYTQAIYRGIADVVSDVGIEVEQEVQQVDPSLPPAESPAEDPAGPVE